SALVQFCAKVSRFCFFLPAAVIGFLKIIPILYYHCDRWFRDIEFKGIKAVKSEEIQKKYRDCYFFTWEIRLALHFKRNLRNWDLARIDFVQYIESFIKDV
ncbi:MAG: hypothetical protein ACLVGL_03375, partial [Waltera sp.]